MFAQSSDSVNTDDIAEFLDDSIKGTESDFTVAEQFRSFILAGLANSCLRFVFVFFFSL